MNQSDNQDDSSSNEFAISVGDDLLAEALNAVEKRLYSKQESEDGADSDVEIDIEFDLDGSVDFDNILGDESIDLDTDMEIPVSSNNHQTQALKQELENVKAQLKKALQAQASSKEAERDARDENRRTLLKQKRLIDANAQLNLDIQDLRDTQKQWEQMVSDLKADAANQSSERANQRNRLKRDVDEAKRAGTERVLKHLMVPLDHIELALKHVGDSAGEDPIISGFIAAIKEVKEALGKAGLSTVEALVGGEFNPEVHEAIARAHSKEVERSHILEVHRSGFMLDGKLYRPSQVTVSGGDDPDLLNE